MSFEKFLKSQRDGDEFTKRVLKHLNDDSGYQADPTLYKPVRDAAGVYNGLIRFLPQQDDQKSPYVIVTKFDLQLPKGKFTETSLKTYGLPCPVWEYYLKTKKEDPERAERFKPWSSHICNIVVLKDKNTPSNTNKVFKYSFGWSLMQMLKDKINPTDVDEQSVNIFSFLEGADFELKIRTKQYKDKATGKEMKSPNYELSSFRSQSQLYDGDVEKMRAVYDALYNLDEYTKPAKIMTYEQMEEKFFRMLGKVSVSVASDVDEMPEFGIDDIKIQHYAQPTKAAEPKSPKIKAKSPVIVEDDDDDLDLGDDDSLDDLDVETSSEDSLDDLLNDLSSPEPMAKVNAKATQKAKPQPKTTDVKKVDIDEEFNFDDLDSLDLE